LRSFGRFFAVLAGNVVTILVDGPGLRLRSVFAAAAWLAACLIGGAARGGGRWRRGLARRQRNSANDFVGQLGIRVHDDLHRHVEIVALLLLRCCALRSQAQQQKCCGHDACAHDPCPARR
jgi:hypothetical protein